jgi:hypothetical protein
MRPPRSPHEGQGWGQKGPEWWRWLRCRSWGASARHPKILKREQQGASRNSNPCLRNQSHCDSLLLGQKQLRLHRWRRMRRGWEPYLKRRVDVLCVWATIVLLVCIVLLGVLRVPTGSTCCQNPASRPGLLSAQAWVGAPRPDPSSKSEPLAA